MTPNNMCFEVIGIRFNTTAFTFTMLYNLDKKFNFKGPWRGKKYLFIASTYTIFSFFYPTLCVYP